MVDLLLLVLARSEGREAIVREERFEHMRESRQSPPPRPPYRRPGI